MFSLEQRLSVHDQHVAITRPIAANSSANPAPSWPGCFRPAAVTFFAAWS